MAEYSAWTEAESQITSLLSAYCFYWVKRKKSNEVSYLKYNTSVRYLELHEQSSARSSPLKTDMRSDATQKPVLICSLPEISPWSLDFVSLLLSGEPCTQWEAQPPASSAGPALSGRTRLERQSNTGLSYEVLWALSASTAAEEINTKRCQITLLPHRAAKPPTADTESRVGAILTIAVPWRLTSD